MKVWSRRIVPVFILALTTTTAFPDDAGRARRRTPVVEVVEKCRDAVVNISTTKVVQMRAAARDIFDLAYPRTFSRPVESIGSGLVIHESGIIVTNAHVVAQAADIRVLFADQSSYDATLVAIDHGHDLAILRIAAPKPLAYVQLGQSDDLMIGETVVAIGNPVGLGHSVSTGIVSAIKRDLQINPELELTSLIQTDAPINPGNSGGPLLNINGQLIGINTAIRGDAQSIGFAIPVARLWELLPTMLDIEKRERIEFGLTVAGPEARVSEVRPNSPAEQAGVRTGDRIVRLDNRPTRDGIDYYVQLLGRDTNQPVSLAVLRNGSTQNLRVALRPLPPPDGAALGSQFLGVQALEVPDDLLRKERVPRGCKVIIETVNPRGPAFRAGLRAGDFITAIGRAPIRSLSDLGLALESANKAERLQVSILRWSTDPPESGYTFVDLR